MPAYLRALVAGACLLLLGMALVIRKFRRDAAGRNRLLTELQTANEKLTAALAAARSHSDAKTQFLGHVGQLLGGESRIAEQLIGFSRLESGQFELQSIAFQPAQIVTEVLDPYTAESERKGVKLKTELGKSLSNVVKGDPDALRKILDNLLSNALRFTQKGEIVLSAKETIGTEGKTSLRFEVRDTGIGLTGQCREHIFQPFLPERAAAERSEGTGLGLAISKMLVELMGGKLDVATRPALGSTFWFTVVFESVSSSAEHGPQPRAVKKGKTEKRTEPRHAIDYAPLLRSETAGIASVRILDISGSGLRVSAPFRLDLLSDVEIRIEGRSVIGVVRNCKCIRPTEFHVGIEISKTDAGGEEFLRNLTVVR